MNRTSILIAAALGTMLPSTMPAGAAQRDSRIATRPFEENAIVSLHGRVGIQSMVAFGPDERIENVAVGDSAAWQVTPNKRADLLFVKPMTPRARTNMTVITDQHTYLFDLVSAPAGEPIYMLRFSYPASIKAAPKSVVPLVTSGQASATAAVNAIPATPAAAEPDPARLNFAWDAKGDKALIPSRWFDDGRHIYLAWPKDASLPAVLIRAPNGAEGPVNYIVRGDYVVVDGVPTQLVLRRGKQVATLTQLHPSPSPMSNDAAALPRTASVQP